jgi:serine/threonine protein phosphatase 1
VRWIIGDIHGMLRPLEKILGAIDRRDREARLFFLGDYINRGPDSRGVIDLLLGLKNASFLRGNHDDILDHILHDHSYAAEPGEEERVAGFLWFMQYGLDLTFFSYGITASQLEKTAAESSAEALDELAAAIPQAHRDFLRNLPLSIDQEDFFLVHAKWPVGRSSEPSIEKQIAGPRDLYQMVLWGRYSPEEIEAKKNWRRKGYFGHTPVICYSESAEPVPVLGPQMVLLDTAVAYDGRLSAWCHETGEFIQADAAGKLLNDG